MNSKFIVLLALGFVCVSTRPASAAENSYQSKFQNSDWDEGEILKPQNTLAAPLDSRASSPSSASSASSSKNKNGERLDDWPTDLPRLSTDAKSNSLTPTTTLSTSPSTEKTPLKVEVSESVSVIAEKVAALKKEPEAKVYDIAKQALSNSNYELAIPLFQMLSERSPRDPRYFYGAGLAQKASGDSQSAFPNLLMAWHLGDDDVYSTAANQVVGELKKSMDPTFKLTFNWQREDPQVVLNAGTRLWKLGMTQQAVQLFEYTLKNDPIYRGIAAYNLGAISEHNGDAKRAARFYEWALKQRAAIQKQAQLHPEMAAEVVQMEKLCPTTYMETALADVQEASLKGGITGWNGWQQASSYPQYWGSEVCPLCAISRTSLKYNAGQMELR